MLTLYEYVSELLYFECNVLLGQNQPAARDEGKSMLSGQASKIDGQASPAQLDVDVLPARAAIDVRVCPIQREFHGTPGQGIQIDIRLQAGESDRVHSKFLSLAVFGMLKEL